MRGAMSLYLMADFSPKYFINDFKVNTSNRQNVHLKDNIILISKSLCSDLRPDEIKSILVTYNLMDQYGSELPQIATFELTNTQKGPEIFSSITHQSFINDNAFCFDLIPHVVSI